MNYPSRESHFAHRFVRVLHKSCAAQDIGPAACFLLCVIAHTEDAGRYAGPARFWNSQLMETLGFRSPKQLDKARDRAIAAGWLVYDRGGNRSVGRYFVTIPPQFQSLTSDAIEADHTPPIHSAGGTNSGTNSGKVGPTFFPYTERIGDGKRNEKVTESGKPSNPIPIPNPIPSCPAREPDAPSEPPGKQPKAPDHSPEDRSTAEAIWRDIVARQPTRKPPNFDQWANDVRLMRERDKRTHEAILALWRRVQADSFWRDNVLSPAKLREKFDDLELKLKPQASRHPARVHSGDRYANVDRSCN